MASGNPPRKRTGCLDDEGLVKLLLVLSVGLAHCLAPRVAWPTVVETTLTFTPEPVGSGARALGQSAFIAVADDATAASWNPAGLIQLEKPEACLVGAWGIAANDPSSQGSYASAHGEDWSEGQVNFMSYVQPLSVKTADAVLSINYHQVYSFQGSFSGESIPGDFVRTVRGESTGAIAAYSLAGGLSLRSHPEVTVGASFNWYAQSLLYDYAWRGESTASFFYLSELLGWSTATETFDDFEGYNFTLGLLWDLYEREANLLTLGFVCHTPFTAEVHREAHSVRSDGLFIPLADDRMEITFPLSLGVGANYRFSDSLSTAIDVQWTDWSEFKWEYADGALAPPIEDDTVAVRLGFERLWFSEPSRDSVYALRGGVFYESRPALDGAVPVYGFSLGIGWTLKDRFSLDFAYQYRWGGPLSGRNVIGTLTGVDYRIEEHFFVTSLITYF